LPKGLMIGLIGNCGRRSWVFQLFQLQNEEVGSCGQEKAASQNSRRRFRVQLIYLPNRM
jgi:hypothetical protein